jgi:putative oxidoreductase
MAHLNYGFVMQTAPFLEASSQNAAALSVGLLVARLVFGVVMSAHGAQKLFGWFGGYGLTVTGGFFEQLGFRPGRVFVAIASATEIVAGLLIAFGLLGPVGPALMLSVMIVAAVAGHWANGFFATSNGIELPLLYASVAVVLALTGPGLLSLDAMLGLEALWSPAFAAVAIAVGVIGGIGNLAARRRPAPSASDIGLRTT